MLYLIFFHQKISLRLAVIAARFIDKYNGKSKDDRRGREKVNPREGVKRP
jgi:hypothetical protein